MPRPVKRTIVLTIVLAVAVAFAGATWLWWETRSDDGAFRRAVAAAPRGTERISWTDWAGVRGELGSSLDATSTGAELQAFLDAGHEADLTSRSALLESASPLQASFGFSPASVEWELFSQSAEGAVIMLGMPDVADFGRIADDLEDLGYDRPTTDTGVWSGGPDLLSRLDPALTPELAYVALDQDQRRVLTSDQPSALETAVRAATGDDPGAEGLDAVTDALDAPLSAAVYTGAYACGALAMARADPDDQAQAAELVAAAGTVDPYRAFSMGVLPGGKVRVAMEFATDEAARSNADSRAVLASGPAVGQGGDYADRFALRSARAEGALLLLDLTPVEGAYVLSDLTSGPVLFATC